MTNPNLLAALTSARLSVDRYVTERSVQGRSWSEVSASERLCMAAYPFIEYSDFNPRQEGVVGADWLWWWLDETGECFGLLVQAKKLQHRGNEWYIDFRYPRNSGEQMSNLFATADLFDVPSAYVLYCGDIEYRTGLECGARHEGSPCVRCDRAGVSIIAGLAVRTVLSWSALSHPGQGAVDAFHMSTPIEDLADPAKSQDPVMDLNWLTVGSELRQFLREPQHGARHVAKLVFERVSWLRRGQMSLVVPEMVDVDSASIVFSEFPTDRGHFGVPYFPFILRGLRTRLPPFVQDVVNGKKPDPGSTHGIGGIVIVHC